MEYNKVQRLRNRTLLIVTLVAVGIASGSVFLYVESLNGTKDLLILDYVNGKVILDAEDRELLMQKVINITLEDDQVKALTAGKTFTTHVTLIKSIQEIEETIANDSCRRIHIEFDYVAIVTLTFEDGSGYNIPVNWEEWTVGEPEYSAQVSPPSNIRKGPPETRERQGTWN
jgi:hypothetical protein